MRVGNSSKCVSPLVLWWWYLTAVLRWHDGGMFPRDVFSARNKIKWKRRDHHYELWAREQAQMSHSAAECPVRWAVRSNPRTSHAPHTRMWGALLGWLSLPRLPMGVRSSWRALHRETSALELQQDWAIHQRAASQPELRGDVSKVFLGPQGQHCKPLHHMPRGTWLPRGGKAGAGAVPRVANTVPLPAFQTPPTHRASCRCSPWPRSSPSGPCPAPAQTFPPCPDPDPDEGLWEGSVTLTLLTPMNVMFRNQGYAISMLGQAEGRRSAECPLISAAFPDVHYI